VVRAPDTGPVDDIASFLDRVTRVSGHVALSEHKRMTLHHAAAPVPTTGETHLVAGVLARAGERSDLIGYAPLVGSQESRRYAVEVVVEPGADPDAQLYDLLVDAVVDVVERLGGGRLRLWTAAAGDSDDARALAHGLRVERSLVQMRCALPLPDHTGRGPTIDTRPFRPGLDEEAWLSTNNRAFASHPEQGRWELSTLLEREKEPWFDPDGLLLLEEDGRVAGSCWTKVHRDTDPPMGEIYVIGVDPDFHGRGWGRALTEAGLAWLSGQGLTVGMLYVDADNAPALTMYRSMGFIEDHVDRAYLGQFGPADSEIGSAGTHQMADGVGDGGGDTRDE
jgi:mycothiol synthase